MQARIRGLTAAIALFQLMATGPINAQSQKPTPDSTTTKRQGVFEPKAVKQCKTSQGPAPLGQRCGTRPDLFECNGINTNCCARTDTVCLSGG
jgi:hypothetical protein